MVAFYELSTVMDVVFAAGGKISDQCWLDEAQIPARCRVRYDWQTRCLVASMLQHASPQPSARAQKQLYMLITLPIWAAGISAGHLITAIHQCGA